LAADPIPLHPDGSLIFHPVIDHFDFDDPSRHFLHTRITFYSLSPVLGRISWQVTGYKNLAEEGDGNTEITGTMALLGGLLTLTR
jgi:hypothetical protein